MNRRMVRAARTRLEWSQKHLADLVGIKQPTIANYESGRTQLSAKTLKAIEKALMSPQSPSKEQPAFGRWVRNTRHRKGFTLQQLADHAGVSVPQLCNLEKGRTLKPRPTTRMRLVKALEGRTKSAVTKLRPPGRSGARGPAPTRTFGLQGSEEHRELQQRLCELGVNLKYKVETNKDIGARIRPDVLWYKLDPRVHNSGTSHVFEIERGGSQGITKSLASLKHARDMWPGTRVIMIVPKAKVSDVKARLPGSFHEIQEALEIHTIEDLKRNIEEGRLQKLLGC